jgi:hypothetical protein
MVRRMEIPPLNAKNDYGLRLSFLGEGSEVVETVKGERALWSSVDLDHPGERFDILRHRRPIPWVVSPHAFNELHNLRTPLLPQSGQRGSMSRI